MNATDLVERRAAGELTGVGYVPLVRLHEKECTGLPHQFQ